MSQNTSKTFGIHRLKLGQLMTLNNHVYQCVKYEGWHTTCQNCAIFSKEHWAESYIMCKKCNREGYFKLIK